MRKHLGKFDRMMINMMAEIGCKAVIKEYRSWKKKYISGYFNPKVPEENFVDFPEYLKKQMIKSKKAKK